MEEGYLLCIFFFRGILLLIFVFIFEYIFLELEESEYELVVVVILECFFIFLVMSEELILLESVEEEKDVELIKEEMEKKE